MNGSSVILTPDQKNILVCSSNFHPQQNTTPVMGEITADQILDMPIVFADEPPQEEVQQHTAENSSYIIINDDVVKEEPVDEENQRVVKLCGSSIPERLKIKQVCIKYIMFK